MFDMVETISLIDSMSFINHIGFSDTCTNDRSVDQSIKRLIYRSSEEAGKDPTGPTTWRASTNNTTQPQQTKQTTKRPSKAASEQTTKAANETKTAANERRARAKVKKTCHLTWITVHARPLCSRGSQKVLETPWPCSWRNSNALKTKTQTITRRPGHFENTLKMHLY